MRVSIRKLSKKLQGVPAKSTADFVAQVAPNMVRSNMVLINAIEIFPIHTINQWCRAGLKSRGAHVERCWIWVNPTKIAGIRWNHPLKSIEIVETLVEIL